MSPAPRKGLPTSDEFAVWRAYIETAHILSSRLQVRLRGDSHLSEGDYKILLALSETPRKTLRSSELAAHIEWERSRLSGHLGRMEKRGLIRRESFADDARGSLVVLTDDGARAFRASTIPHLQAIKALFVDAFTPAQLDRIEETTAALRAHLDLPPMRREPSS